MNKKKHPELGHMMTVEIILNFNGFCNNEIITNDQDFHFITPEKPKKSQEYTLTRSNGKTVTLKSERLLRAFSWLQGKEHTTISKDELAEAFSLNKDQVQKVMHTLKSEKKLIYYEHDTEGRYKIVRVDDINRLIPRFDGVDYER